MILFLADGRLGNQIFQYAFLKTIQRDNENIIVSGFEELREVFKINNIINLNKKNKFLRIFIYRIMKPILIFLADKKIISSINVNHEKILSKYRRETTTYSKQKGLFDGFIFVKLGFFQSEDFFNNKIVEDLNIQDKYLSQADELLNRISVNTNKVFVHIRRGDYKNYKVYGKSTLLPINYFHEQIKWFQINRENPFFIFLSDETEFIEEEFKYVKNKIISLNNHSGTDLAIMTKCNSAILSPSSFSWWGSYLMKERDIVFAPKYWLGFRSKVEYMENEVAKFMTAIEVTCDDK